MRKLEISNLRKKIEKDFLKYYPNFKKKFQIHQIYIYGENY